MNQLFEIGAVVLAESTRDHERLPMVSICIEVVVAMHSHDGRIMVDSGPVQREHLPRFQSRRREQVAGSGFPHLVQYSTHCIVVEFGWFNVHSEK